MQNREVPVGNLPIFFSSRQRAEAGRSRPGVRGAGCGKRARSAERRRRGHGRRTRNAKRGTRKTRTRARGCVTQNTDYWPRAAEHGKRGHGAQETGAQETGHRRRGTSPRAWTAARPHTPTPCPATTRRGHSQPGAIHRRDATPYLSRVRIRITPLPPRTPYMLLPRCTSTDLTS